MDIGATNGRIATYANGLHLNKPRRSDTGTYQAKASNPLGTVFSEHINLTVLGGFLYWAYIMLRIIYLQIINNSYDKINFLLKYAFVLRCNMKHSEECFITYPNTSKCVKKTRLRLVFSTHFSVFGYVMKHSSECFIYYLSNSLLIPWINTQRKIISVSCFDTVVKNFHKLSQLSPRISL